MNCPQKGPRVLGKLDLLILLCLKTKIYHFYIIAVILKAISTYKKKKESHPANCDCESFYCSCSILLIQKKKS